MDVTLPNGVVVKGIPDGTTKAELATKLKSNGMDVPAEWMAPEPKQKSIGQQVWGGLSSLGEEIAGVGETALTGVTGIAAPVIGNIAGVGKSITGGKYGTQEGVQQGADLANKIREELTYKPQTAAGQRNVSAIGGLLADSKLEGLGPMGAEFEAPFAAGAKAAARAPQTTAALQAVPRVVGKAVDKTADVASKGLTLGKDVAGDVLGVRVPAARQEAAKAMQEAGATASSALTKSAQEEALRAKAMESVRKNLENEVQAAYQAPENLDVQGNAIRKSFTSAMDVAKQARAKTADEMFTLAKTKAAAKEASGVTVDTSNVVKPLKRLLAEADGIPDLTAQINKMISAVEGAGPTPKGTTINMGEGISVPVQGQKAAKSFEQLELTRRYLNDIGYSSDLEGYPAIVRSAARDAAKEIDNSMQSFVPEFGRYKAEYRRMSEPMESLGTRFGKAISGTEGGITEGAYSKVSSADLPSRLFRSKEGVDLMIDALAGGKNASKEARAAATKQVESMVQNWILESTRGKKPQARLEALQAPGMRGTLSAVPEVESTLTKQFGTVAGKEETAKSMQSLAKEAAERGVAKTKAASELKTELRLADDLAEGKSSKSKQEAFSAYRSILQKGAKQGLIPEDQYKAALNLIDRTSSLEEKSKIARTIASSIAGFSAFEKLKKYAQ